MLLGSILTNTFASARRFWKRLLGVYVITSLVAGLVSFWAQTTLDGGGPPALGVVLAFLAQLIGCWALLAAIRVPMHNDEIGEALGGALGPAPKLFVSSLVLVVLVVPTLLVLPHVVLAGAIAANPTGWGLGPALRLGVLRVLRNFGAYVALLVIVACTVSLGAVLLVLPVLATAGIPSAADVASLDAVAAWAGDAMVGLQLGALLAALPGAVLWPPFVAATWAAMQQREEVRSWGGEDLEPVVVTQELSPAVTALLGASTEPRQRPRMKVPPRAAEPGRLPGPGVLAVADLMLPPGTTTRPVDSPTLELDAFDAAPSSDLGGGMVTAPTAAAMWVSTKPHDAAPSAWKQLASGFAETGLWPLLLPAESLDTTAPWPDQRARRERDALDATPEELLQARLEGSLRDTPLSSAELLAASGLAHGRLGRGSGRRVDALAHAFDLLGNAHLALVAVRRPAEAVHRLAWPGTIAAGITGAEFAEVLASWEERYGAILVGMTESSLVLAVLSPPATLEEAVEVAAEHHATCPDEAEDWGDDRSYAQSLIDAPTWRLTWS